MQLLNGADEVSERECTVVEPFGLILSKHGIRLEREQTTTLQINVGLLCNQLCRHCHLDAGPARTGMMDEETLDEVVAFAQRNRFETIDITGGAPEMHPKFFSMIERLSPLANRTLVRSNLSVLEAGKTDLFIDVFKRNRVVVVASFPSLNRRQTEAQRGKGIFQKSINALMRLNAAGYGREGTGLELDLVSNPTGAFLPPSQAQVEERFRPFMKEKWGIVFNSLYTFANMPLGRFRQWLHDSGNFDKYMKELTSNFNLCAVEGLMCRSLVSVAWDGYLHDCDFNLAAGIPMAGQKAHISEISDLPGPGTPIAVADHCYTCTAGAGFT